MTGMVLCPVRVISKSQRETRCTYIGDWNENMMHTARSVKIRYDTVKAHINGATLISLTKRDGRIFMAWASSRMFKNDSKCGVGIYLWKDGRANLHPSQPTRAVPTMEAG